MPSAGVITNILTTPVTAASHPLYLFVNGRDLVLTVPDVTTVSFTESATGDRGVGKWQHWDPLQKYTNDIVDGALVRWYDAVNDVDLFKGFLYRRKPQVIATGGMVDVEAFDGNRLYDRTLVVSDTRGPESDIARVSYLIGTYGGDLSPDTTFLTQTNALLPAARFVNCTLRTALEQTAALASTNTTFYADQTWRTHWFSSEGLTAPFAIRIGTPGGGEIAPENFLIDYDSSGIINAYYVRGKTPAGSGWFTDRRSNDMYGRREAYIDAPDSDTFAKAQAIGYAALLDTSQPIPRGTFTVTSTPGVALDGWHAGQTLSVMYAPQFGITALKNFQILKVTTRFTRGDLLKAYDCEFGGTRASVYRGRTGGHMNSGGQF